MGIVILIEVPRQSLLHGPQICLNMAKLYAEQSLESVYSSTDMTAYYEFIALWLLMGSHLDSRGYLPPCCPASSVNLCLAIHLKATRLEAKLSINFGVTPILCNCLAISRYMQQSQGGWALLLMAA